MTYNNAGIAGTPSKLGIVRLDRDVLSTDPDICFVEFAVNDGGENDFQMAYESIIRTLIEHDVAVVLVFAVTEEGHSCQEYMQTIEQVQAGINSSLEQLKSMEQELAKDLSSPEWAYKR